METDPGSAMGTPTEATFTRLGLREFKAPSRPALIRTITTLSQRKKLPNREVQELD